jgi:alkanesulfonate monooxygenase SsuD/methylene tetrahydromethanopterin reductase-like flavin-dependent oxidoreductase (luciferase family)
MDIGICVASHVGDIEYAVRAEDLGFASLWFADSQMLWSDCYACLALAADRTEHIRLGTGVAVTGTRPAPVNAASIATINALAPGRTFLGVGAGNTAMRVMGRKPQRIAEFDRYLAELKPLLAGEEAQVRFGDASTPIRHVMPDRGFVNFADPIPLHVSGFGPRALGLAGRHGDGAVLGWPPSVGILERFLGMVRAGAAEAGRDLPEDYRFTALTTVTILDDGEDIDSPRVHAECGAMAMAGLHYAYDSWRQLGAPPPKAAEPIWDEYCAMIAAVPEGRRHQRIHAGHNCWVLPEEERFVTPELIRNTCLVGTATEVLDRLRAYDAAGLDEIIVLPAFEPRYDVIERIGGDLIPALAP